MPIEPAKLDAIARTYVQGMTSIRGRRVHRLVVREFKRFDRVLPALAEDGSAALLALADDGQAAVCRTDGRGNAASVAACAALDGATVTTAYDLLKDSLPVLGWTLWHAGLAREAGALTISAAALSAEDRAHVADLARRRRLAS
jgi:hypothetical protein